MSYSYVGYQCPLCYEDHKWILKKFKNWVGLRQHLFKSHTPSKEYVEKIKNLAYGQSLIKNCLERGILR